MFVNGMSPQLTTSWSGGSCSELELSETDNNSKHSGMGALSALWGASHLLAELHLCEEPKFVLGGGPVGG